MLKQEWKKIQDAQNSVLWKPPPKPEVDLHSGGHLYKVEMARVWMSEMLISWPRKHKYYNVLYICWNDWISKTDQVYFFRVWSRLDLDCEVQNKSAQTDMVVLRCGFISLKFHQIWKLFGREMTNFPSGSFIIFLVLSIWHLARTQVIWVLNISAGLCTFIFCCVLTVLVLHTWHYIAIFALMCR